MRGGETEALGGGYRGQRVARPGSPDSQEGCPRAASPVPVRASSCLRCRLLETGATAVSLPRETGVRAPGLPASALGAGDGRRSAQLSGSSWVSAKSEAAGLVPWPPERGLVLTATGNQALAQPQCPHP